MRDFASRYEPVSHTDDQPLQAFELGGMTQRETTRSTAVASAYIAEIPVMTVRGFSVQKDGRRAVRHNRNFTPITNTPITN